MIRIIVGTKFTWFGLQIWDDGKVFQLAAQIFKRPSDFWFYVNLKFFGWSKTFKSWKSVYVRNVGLNQQVFKE